MTASRLQVVMTCGALLLTACSKCNTPPKQKVGPATSSVVPQGSATTASAPVTAALRVSTSVNGATSATVHRGWPLVITASVGHRGHAVVIPEISGSWTGAARVELRAGNATVPLTTRLATSPPGSLVVDDDTVGVVTWTVAAADVDRLPAGDYQLRVIVDTSASASVAVRIDSGASPAAAESERQLWLASANMQAGDRAAAVVALDLALAARADDVSALIFKAGLIGRDDPVAGVALYDRALRKLRPHPPGVILQRRNELWQQLLHQ